jgi:hypothetical protein
MDQLTDEKNLPTARCGIAQWLCHAARTRFGYLDLPKVPL